MCLAVALAFCSPWQVGQRPCWMSQSEDPALAGVRSRTETHVLAQPEAVLEQRLPQVRVGVGAASGC